MESGIFCKRIVYFLRECEEGIDLEKIPEPNYPAEPKGEAWVEGDIGIGLKENFELFNVEVYAKHQSNPGFEVRSFGAIGSSKEKPRAYVIVQG